MAAPLTKIGGRQSQFLNEIEMFDTMTVEVDLTIILASE